MLLNFEKTEKYTGCCKTSGKLRKHITETLYGVFFVFLGSYDCQIWAIFHFGTLWAYGWKKSWKIWPWKKARFQGWLKLADFMVVEFWGLPTLVSIISGISSSISKICVPILMQITILPIFDSHKSPKTQRKLHKMSQLCYMLPKFTRCFATPGM